MYKLLVFYLGAVTLLAFTEAAPVPSNSPLKAIQEEIKLLNKSASVISTTNLNIPINIKATSFTNALACFVIEMCSVQEVIKVEINDNNVLNIVDKIMANAYKYLGQTNMACENYLPLEEMCNTCQKKQGGNFLTEFSNLLKRIVSSQ